MKENTNTNTPHQREIRHKAHQEMLEWHKILKQEARDRHKSGAHKLKYPLTLFV